MKKVLGVLAVAALVVASPARATNGVRLIGFGPIQESMGGVSAAAPLDGVTAVTNPAGLSLLGDRLDLAGAAFAPTVKFTVGPQGDTSSRPTDYLPTIAGVWRTNEALTLGIAALGTAGMGVDYTNGLGGQTMTSYMNGRIAPAVAYKVNDQVSLGLAVNLMYAQLKFAIQGMAPPASNSFGYGATIGVTYKPHEAVLLGAAFETQSYFQDFSFDVGGGQTIKLKFDQPMVATVGVGYQGVKGLLLAADVQWINWSATNGQNKPEITQGPPGFAFNMNWSDQWVFKVGAQYAIPSLEALKLRLGFDYGKSPTDSTRAFENILFPAIAESHITVGAGYDIQKWTVNASYLYAPEVKLSGDAAALGAPGATWSTTMSQMAFQLGVAYRF